MPTAATSPAATRPSLRTMCPRSPVEGTCDAAGRTARPGRPNDYIGRRHRGATISPAGSPALPAAPSVPYAWSSRLARSPLLRSHPGMNAVQREYILKGVFLGLWAYLAAAAAGLGLRSAGWSPGRPAGWRSGWSPGRSSRSCRGYKPAGQPGRVPAAGAAGQLVRRLPRAGRRAGDRAADRTAADPTPRPTYPIRDWLGYFAIGGAVLGYGFYQLTPGPRVGVAVRAGDRRRRGGGLPRRPLHRRSASTRRRPRRSGSRRTC